MGEEVLTGPLTNSVPSTEKKHTKPKTTLLGKKYEV